MPNRRFPTEQDTELTKSRLQRHALQYIGTGGVVEIRSRLKGEHLYLEVVKQTEKGLFKRVMGNKAVAKLARLEYEGPNRWKFLIYDHQIQKYVVHKGFGEGTIEECLDAAAGVYL